MTRIFSTMACFMTVVTTASCNIFSVSSRTKGMIIKSSSATRTISHHESTFQSPRSITNNNVNNPFLLQLRGGATSKKKKSTSKKKKSTSKTKKSQKAPLQPEEPSPLSQTLTKYRNILPLTRLYITCVAIVTLLALLLGEETAQSLLALDPARTIYGLELWRPFTAASFLGPPSIGWLMNTYYLFEYGSSLERAFGSAQHVIFLLVQLTLLSVLSVLLGQPFFGSSVTTSMLHVLSRSMPRQNVKWLIFTVPYWSLPYGLMAGDVLQSGSAMSAIPHVMGIVSGHCYFFHKFVWPKVCGGGEEEDWLTAPDFLVRWFDVDAKKDSSKKKVSAALKRKKKGQGRKLGGK